VAAHGRVVRVTGSEGVEVGAAHAARRHVDDHPTFGGLGLGDFDHLHATEPGDQRDTHEGNCRSPFLNNQPIN
jgi:hypothetical protein